MDEQIAFGGFEAPDEKEREFLDSVLDKLRETVSKVGLSEASLKTKVTSDYTALFLSNITVCRIRFRGKRHYFAVPIALKDLISAEFEVSAPKSNPKYVNVYVDQTSQVKYADFLVCLVAASIQRYPKEYDCCSRYEQCSDAKACIHPDKGFALGCGYRKILSSGRIFYGKNRNVK